MAMEEEDDQFCESKSGRNKELEPSSSSPSSFGSPSNSSCFSEDDGDEASSSPPSTSSSSSSSNSSSSSALHANNNINADSPLYELSQLMAQLPIKRGLSRFYQGKSQSYTSLLGSVNSLEDLAKKRVANSGRILKMKTKCRSFCWGLERQKHCYGPKPAISKKGSSTSRGSSSSCFTSLQFPRPPAPSPSFFFFFGVTKYCYLDCIVLSEVVFGNL